MFFKKNLYRKIEKDLNNPKINHNILSEADIKEIFEHLMSEEKIVLKNMIKMFLFDDHLYYHSMAVCCLAYYVAKQLGYDNNKVREIVVSGLIHDIGKTKLSRRLIKYKGKHSPEQYTKVKEHPTLGYELILNKYPNINTDIVLNILDHHEKLDGSGYPNRKRAEELTEASRIISVCDSYDAFVSNRSYHGARTPPEGIRALKEEVIGGHFDKRITSKVIKAIKENNNYDFRFETKRVPAGRESSGSRL